MILVKKYNEQYKNLWNEFNKKSKNHLFMFDRKYMEYHKDRFIDHSLLFFSDEKLAAILPLNEDGECLCSHGGLTYGGFISDEKMKQHTMNECFNALLEYCSLNGFKQLIYKPIPHIYHNLPAEEDRYSLFAIGAKVESIDASTYINLKEHICMTKGRKAQISRAKRECVNVKCYDELESYETFIRLANEVLNERHNVNAVHTGRELKLLHDKFPFNIHLFLANRYENIIAGSVVFEYENVIHIQYMAANEEARQYGALDLIIKTIIDKYKESKTWIDFGISTEHGRVFLNEGLIAQKESFGGRTGVYETWKITL